MLEENDHSENGNAESYSESRGLRELLRRSDLIFMIFTSVVLIIVGAIRLTRVSIASTIESFHTYVEPDHHHTIAKNGWLRWISGEKGFVGSFTSFWTKLPHRFWSFYIESFLIPGYRKEWGKYRSWSYRARERSEKHFHIRQLIRIQKRMRQQRQNAMKEDQEAYDMIHNHILCRRVRINVSGMKYETQLRTLERFPDTLLGNPSKRIQYYDPIKEEYYFDRNRIVFESILYFYQSGGRIRRPENIQADVLIKDAQFYQLSHAVIDQFRLEEGMSPINNQEEILPMRLISRKIWILFEYPESSLPATYVAILSICALFLSIAIFCIETIEEMELTPELGVIDQNETICNIWFIFEFVTRLLCCPLKGKFIKSPLNLIDFIAVMPFIISILFPTTSTIPLRENNATETELSVSAADSLKLVRIVRVVRVFRIFKLSRHSRGLKILGKTLKASLNELLLLIFFILLEVVLFSSTMYFAELDHPNSQFESIPSGFWWAVITITTVGFGDVVPITILGKIVGSLCAVAGVLTIALPVPVIVSNFNFFYHQAIGESELEWISINHVASCPYRPTGCSNSSTMMTQKRWGKKPEKINKKVVKYSSDEDFGQLKKSN